MYHEEKYGDGYDTYGQIGPFLEAMEIEDTQIFEEEESKPSVAVPVQWTSNHLRECSWR